MVDEALGHQGLGEMPAPVNLEFPAWLLLRADGLVSYSASRSRGKIVRIDLAADPERLRELDVAVLDD